MLTFFNKKRWPVLHGAAQLNLMYSIILTIHAKNGLRGSMNKLLQIAGFMLVLLGCLATDAGDNKEPSPIQSKSLSATDEQEQQPSQLEQAPEKVHVEPYVETVQRAQGVMDSKDELFARKLITAGWSVFGTSYAITFVGASVGVGRGSEWAAWTYIPAIGPFIAGALMTTNTAWSGAVPVGVLTMAAGLAQLTGLGLLTAGYVKRDRYRRSEENAGSKGTRQRDQ